MGAGLNHFEISTTLAEPGGLLARAALEMVMGPVDGGRIAVLDGPRKAWMRGPDPRIESEDAQERVWKG